MKIPHILVIMVWFMAAFGCVGLFMYIFDVKVIVGNSNSEIYEMDLQGIPDCNKTTLELTVECLNIYIKEIFNFRKWDNSEDLTLYELKKRGGDCVDYSSFYITALMNYGYEAEPILTDGHVFVVGWDSSGYCIIDQTSMDCSTLATGEIQ